MVVVAARLIDDLRAATRAQHEALDASVDIGSYAPFLRASLAALELLEPAIAAWIPFGVERTPALREDLAALGVEPAAPVALPIANASEAWGAAYVVEGSSLGGLVIAERVGSPHTRYLRLHGKETAARWRQFLAQLEAAPIDRAACCAAAVGTFDHYARVFRAHGVAS